jgi:hypothetical protein
MKASAVYSAGAFLYLSGDIFGNIKDSFRPKADVRLKSITP